MGGREAVALYKALHRTVQRVFSGDIPAMLAARDKVCEEFEKNRRVTSQTSITELIKQGEDVNRILGESVVQLVREGEAPPGEQEKFQLNIRPETHMFENNPFRDDVTKDQYKAANRAANFGKCDDEPKKTRKKTSPKAP